MVSEIWNQCFDLAWTAFVEGSIPIGCVIVDNQDNVLAKGRNHIYDNSSTALPGKISHAEMNALYFFNQQNYSKQLDPRQCKLFSTMEPCIMCLGATAFSNIRTVFYAAEDLYAGALHEQLLPRYVTDRITSYHCAPKHYDKLQIVMQTVYLLEKAAESLVKPNNSLELWSKRYPDAVELGKTYYLQGTLRNFASNGDAFADVKERIVFDLERLTNNNQEYIR